MTSLVIEIVCFILLDAIDTRETLINNNKLQETIATRQLDINEKRKRSAEDIRKSFCAWNYTLNQND